MFFVLFGFVCLYCVVFVDKKDRFLLFTGIKYLYILCANFILSLFYG